MQHREVAGTEPLKGTVLVVDDDDGVRRLLARWVETLGHQVILASGAEEGMELMSSCHADVVVCDMRMPGRDGLWVVDQLEQRYPGTGVVLISGMGGEMDPSLARRPGVVGCIGKPFNRDELTDVLKRALASARIRTSAAVAKSMPASSPLPESEIVGS